MFFVWSCVVFLNALVIRFPERGGGTYVGELETLWELNHCGGGNVGT